MTVSRALALPDRLRPETRERVLAAVRRLGYTPNEAARALRAGASRMVLVVVPYLYSGAFFAGVINSIDAELSAEGYTMIVGSLDGIADKARRLVDFVYARQIDGVIILTGHIPMIDGRSLRDANVPIVSICAQLDTPDLPTVLVNDEECAIVQVRHLIDLGHRHSFMSLAQRAITMRSSAIAVLSGRRQPRAQKPSAMSALTLS